MQPQHARLPLWEDKNLAEKVDTLYEMINTLYAYTLQEARLKVLSILDQHPATDQKESDDLAIIRRMTLQHPNIFNMNCEVGHLTGSALVVDLTSGRFVLHYHRYLNLWLPFGGHPDYETDMALVALRESTEESGLPDLRFFPHTNSPRPLDLDVHTIPASKGRPEHLHLDFRYLLATNHPDQLHAGMDESDQFIWLDFASVEDFDEELDPALQRFIGKARQVVESYRD
jgi:8-oxo-dGTP pyrophosphatase MutT (NUDIX family)